MYSGLSRYEGIVAISSVTGAGEKWAVEREGETTIGCEALRGGECGEGEFLRKLILGV